MLVVLKEQQSKTSLLPPRNAGQLFPVFDAINRKLPLSSYLGIQLALDSNFQCLLLLSPPSTNSFCMQFGMLKIINISARIKGYAAWSLLLTCRRAIPQRAVATQTCLQPWSGRATSKEEKATQSFIAVVLRHCRNIISASVVSCWDTQQDAN